MGVGDGQVRREGHGSSPGRVVGLECRAVGAEQFVEQLLQLGRDLARAEHLVEHVLEVGESASPGSRRGPGCCVEAGDVAEAGDPGRRCPPLPSGAGTVGASAPPLAFTSSSRSAKSSTGTAKPTPSLPPRHRGDGGVDADHPALGVGQRTARVARVDRGVGLDEAGEGALRGLQLAVEAGDDAGGHRRLVAEGAAERDGRLAHLHAAGLGDRGGDQVRRRRRPTRWRGRARARGRPPGPASSRLSAVRTVTSSPLATTWWAVRMRPLVS